ncbi:hypothetical protein [uncultured Sphingomonas sp.]|uniref:hypothetical protein n=1 Tax=uncultured Sphingomonas sp. TaxID=158754 RepID=UPI0035C94DC2
MINSIFSRIVTAFFLFASSIFIQSVPAYADSVSAIPTYWRLQDYNDGAVTLFFTGSSCAAGQLLLPSSAGDDSKQRLWSIVATGKAALLPVGIYYHVDSTTGACVIDSFYL